MKIEKEVCDLCGADAMRFCWRAMTDVGIKPLSVSISVFPAIKVQAPDGRLVDGNLCEKHWLELNNLVFKKLAEKAEEGK